MGYQPNNRYKFGKQNNMKKKFFMIFAFIACFFIGVFSIILPWRIRLKYVQMLNLGAQFILQSKYIMEYVNSQAFARESEKLLLTKK